MKSNDMTFFVVKVDRMKDVRAFITYTETSHRVVCFSTDRSYAKGKQITIRPNGKVKVFFEAMEDPAPIGAANDCGTPFASERAALCGLLKYQKHTEVFLGDYEIWSVEAGPLLCVARPAAEVYSEVERLMMIDFLEGKVEA